MNDQVTIGAGLFAIIQIYVQGCLQLMMISFLRSLPHQAYSNLHKDLHSRYYPSPEEKAKRVLRRKQLIDS